MNLVVPIKLVPDLVEELIVNDEGTAIDPGCVRLLINEFDDYAIEQAILLKEQNGGSVTIIAPDRENVDDVLYAAAAKGAERLIKLSGDWDAVDNRALASVFANVIKSLPADVILTGVQAHIDLDGAVGPQLAEKLGLPYVGYVAGVTGVDGKLIARKEYPGGAAAEMIVRLPAVLGIQAASKPPRYVPISKIRQTMKTAKIEACPAPELVNAGTPLTLRLFKPQAPTHAQMIDGDENEIAEKLITIFKENGVL